MIGPLVLCGVLLDTEVLDRLKELGVKDSKRLSRSVRKRLFGEIQQIADAVFTKVITPAEIDRENINLLELRATVEAIRYTSPDVVYLDVPAHPRGIPKYMRTLELLLEKDGISAELVGDNGADRKFMPVSAASVVAKVKRDLHIDELKERYGDFGSGYPSDTRTISFLRALKDKGEMPEIVRKKWKIRALSHPRQP